MLNLTAEDSFEQGYDYNVNDVAKSICQKANRHHHSLHRLGGLKKNSWNQNSLFIWWCDGSDDKVVAQAKRCGVQPPVKVRKSEKSCRVFGVWLWNL